MNMLLEVLKYNLIREREREYVTRDFKKQLDQRKNILLDILMFILIRERICWSRLSNITLLEKENNIRDLKIKLD